MPQPALSEAQDRAFQIGRLRLREHLLNHAELIFRQVLAGTPDHAATQRHLGITLFKLGRADEALPLLRAAAVGEETAEAWADLATALRAGGDAGGAAEAYGRVGGTPPDDLAFSTDRGTHEFRVVDYRYRSEVRYGSGRPSHPGLAALIGAGRARYEAMLADLAELHDDFAAVPLGGSYDAAEPFWLNAWFPPLDAMALTGMLRAYNPARFMEVGSGVSTKFARRAVARHGLRTRLTSIDPQPRNDIDRLCDEVIRKPLEACPLEMFEALEPGDIFFLDSSHRSFQGSDVTVFFLDILPRLKPGVIVHIHDIYLPDDYVSGHVHRLWNEQYLLATALLFGDGRFEVLFPCWFVGQDADLASQARDLLYKGPLTNLNPYGASFWMRTTGP